MGGARKKDVDLLGGDRHQDSEDPSHLQQRRIARVFFLTPETAATIAHLAYGGAAQ